MTHEDAFLQAIVEEPDDDAMRLIFADWLDEHDSPRGEFIRAQCEILQLPPQHPRRRQLHTRAVQLFRQHAQEWVGPLRPFLLRCLFRRGFVESATVRGRVFIRQPQRLFHLTPLRDYVVDLDDVTVPPEVLALLPEHLVWRWRVLPLAVRGGTVFVATARWLDLDTLAALEFYLQRPVRFVPVMDMQLLEAVTRHFGPQGPFYAPLVRLEYHTEQRPVQAPRRERDGETATREVLRILEEAVRRHADEVRVEAFAGRLRERFVIHGIRVDRDGPPLRLLPALVAHFKEMAGLDPAVTGCPQEGSGIVAVAGRARELFVRVSPAARGEAVVVQLCRGGCPRETQSCNESSSH